MTDAAPELDPQRAVDVAVIGPAHGTRGEVRVQSLSDFPDRFRRGARLWLDGRPVRLESARGEGRLLLLKIEGVDDRVAAQALHGKLLQAPEPHTIYTAGTFFQHDIIGLRVESAEGEDLGRVESIFPTGSNDVYVVQGERGEVLLPAVDDVIKSIDVPAGRIVVELLPGLDFSQPAARKPARPRRRHSPKPAS